MKRCILFIVAAVVLLICDASPGWADGELLPLIWKKDGLTYERLCKQGKLVIMSRSSSNSNIPYVILIDLKDSSTIYVTDPKTEDDMFTNYYGDKFYVFNYIEKKWKEYDVKTKKFIRYTFGPNHSTNNSAYYLSSDTVYTEFNSHNHSILFKNLNTGILLDSFKIPNTPNQTYYSASPKEWVFSNNGRYMTLALKTYDKPYTQTFYLYDRVKRELIFQKNVDPYYGYYRYTFLNQSNQMAYAEEIKLPGDDTVYSYIRIFDPDQRKVVKDFKISKIKNDGFRISQDDKYFIYQAGSNYKKIYDIDRDQIIDWSYGVYGGGLILIDSSMLYSYGEGLFAQKMDWPVGIKNNTDEQIEKTIFPNPTTGYISINVNQKLLNGNWILNNLTGEQVKQGLIGNVDTLKLNLFDLPANTYFLTLINGKEKVTYKFIKE
jgi:hypothetical protein